MNWIKGKSYKTVGGHEVVFIKEDGRYLYFTHVEDCETYEHGKDGVPRDLKNEYTVTPEEYTEPRKGEVWVNVYKSGDAIVYSTREVADIEEPDDRIARIRCQWQEGVFDE